jgi:hypothetical protein
VQTIGGVFAHMHALARGVSVRLALRHRRHVLGGEVQRHVGQERDL